VIYQCIIEVGLLGLSIINKMSLPYVQCIVSQPFDMGCFVERENPAKLGIKMDMQVKNWLLLK